MRYIHPMLLLLLYKNCLSESQTANSPCKNSALSEKSDQPTSLGRTNENRTKFTGIIEDVMRLIIQEIPDLIDLLNLAEGHPSITFLVGEAIRQKYSRYETEIWFANDDDSSQLKVNIDPYEKRVQILNYRLSLTMLKCFGWAMKRLTISNHAIHESRENRSANIISYVSTYASDSLVDLNLGIIKKGTLTQLKKSFPAIETLRLVITTDQIGSILPFNELFPQLRRLILTSGNEIDVSFIDCSLPNLEHLSINIFLTTVKKPNSQIEGLIGKNPQLRTLEFTFFPDDYISTVNKFLPNLESLSLGDFVVREDVLHFEHVKSLSVRANDVVPIDKLSLPSLKSAKIQFPIDHSPACKQFFRKHARSLTKLHLKVSRISDADFGDILAELPYLTEMNFECNHINTNAMIRFIETHEQLTKFEFAIRQYEESDLNEIRNRFQNEWEMKDHNHMWCGLLLEKRNSTLLQ